MLGEGEEVKLITALIIISGNDPDLSKQMREAAKFIKTQPKIPGGKLCQETVRALLKLSKTAESKRAKRSKAR